MGFFRDLYNAYIFNNYTAPFLHSMEAMIIPDSVMQEPKEPNRKTRRKNKRKKRKK